MLKIVFTTNQIRMKAMLIIGNAYQTKWRFGETS
jgi:hypothetical protein